MRVLCTGSAGFLGRHVCAELQRRSHTVDGVDAYVQQVHGNAIVPEPHEWRTTVGNAAGRWARSPGQSYDAVVHLAAAVGVGQSNYHPAQYVAHNILETAKLMEAVIARRSEVRRVVVASSMSVYGEGAYKGRNESRGFTRAVDRGWDTFRVDDMVMEHMQPAPTPETKRCEPTSVYAQTKLEQERLCLLLGEMYDVPVIALRFFNIVGRGQALSNPYTGCVMNFLQRIVNGQSPLVTEDGQQTRDFVDVRDVARAVCDAVEAPAQVTGVLNVGTGYATTIQSVAQRLCRLAAQRGLADVSPEVLGQFRKGDVRHCYADVSAIQKALGWTAEINIADTLREIVEWVVAEKVVVPETVSGAFAELRSHGLIG